MVVISPPTAVKLLSPGGNVVPPPTLEPLRVYVIMALTTSGPSGGILDTAATSLNRSVSYATSIAVATTISAQKALKTQIHIYSLVPSLPAMSGALHQEQRGPLSPVAEAARVRSASVMVQPFARCRNISPVFSHSSGAHGPTFSSRTRNWVRTGILYAAILIAAPATFSGTPPIS